MPPWRDKRFIGKQWGGYAITKRIGRGRYGICFLAAAPGGEDVVIKKFKPRIFKKNEKKNMYEAVILSTLKDGRIPELLGVINQENFYGFVLEYKPGHTLKDWLFKLNHVFTPAEVYTIVSQLIEIIRYLHENGVVHRDIRVPNVLYHNGTVSLIDFGLARWADGQKYRRGFDFSYLGDLLLYLLYSSHKENKARQSRFRLRPCPWYEELALSHDQRRFLKKLLGLDTVYRDIGEIAIDFAGAFKPGV